MKITKFLCAAAALTAAVGLLAGCSAGSGSSGNGNGSSTGTLTVYGNSSEKAGLDAVAANFEKANEGVTVDITYSKDPGTSLPTLLSAGTAPDVLWLNSGATGGASVITAAKNGYIRDLSDQPFASKQPKNSISTYDGKAYSASVVIAGIGIAWNKTTLDSLGLSIPQKLSELYAVCDAAKAAGKSAFAIGYQDSWVTQMIPYALESTLVDAVNPEFQSKFAAGEATLPDSNWTEVLDQTKQIAEYPGCFSASPLGTDYNAAAQLVSERSSLGMVMVNSVIPAITQAAPDDELVFSVFPANEDPSSYSMPQSFSGTFAVNSKAKNQTLALKFLNFVTSNEQATLYAANTGGAPYLLDGSVPEAAEANVDITSISKFSSEGKTTPFGLVGMSSKGLGVLITALQDFQAGKVSGKDLLQQVQDANE